MVDPKMNGPDRRWLIHLVLALSIGSSLFAAFLLYQINGIVHGTLYNYGLQFNQEWAVQYWSLERLLYICLFVPSSMGGLVLAIDLWRGRGEKAPLVKRAGNHVSRSIDRSAMKDNSIKIGCPKCKRSFSKYLNMLDYSSGKPQLIKVCPYCSHVLGDEAHVDTNVRVFEPDEEEKVHERR